MAQASGGRDQIDTIYNMRTPSKTKLPNGRLSLLVDLGSRINLTGSNTAKGMALEAERYGYQSKYSDRKHQLNVNGVGSGSAPCNQTADLPLAVQFQDEPASIDNFNVNITEGSGADILAFLGSISRQNKDAVKL